MGKLSYVHEFRRVKRRSLQPETIATKVRKRDREVTEPEHDAALGQRLCDRPCASTNEVALTASPSLLVALTSNV